jgi:hypothetical protein
MFEVDEGGLLRLKTLPLSELEQLGEEYEIMTIDDN